MILILTLSFFSWIVVLADGGLCFFLFDQGSTVGIYFINRPEWLIVDHACSAYSYVSVPLYDTLGKYSVYLFASFF